MVLSVVAAVLAMPYAGLVTRVCTPSWACNGTYAADVTGWERSLWLVAGPVIVVAFVLSMLAYRSSRGSKMALMAGVATALPWVSGLIWIWPPFLPFWETM